VQRDVLREYSWDGLTELDRALRLHGPDLVMTCYESALCIYTPCKDH